MSDEEKSFLAWRIKIFPFMNLSLPFEVNTYYKADLVRVIWKAQKWRMYVRVRLSHSL